MNKLAYTHDLVRRERIEDMTTRQAAESIEWNTLLSM